MRTGRLAVGAVLALLAAGCGDAAVTGARGEDSLPPRPQPPDPGSVAWEADPEVFTNPNLPNDRIMTGVVENRSVEELQLDARDVRVTLDGEQIDSAAAFLRGYSRRLYSPSRSPAGAAPQGEKRRIGAAALVAPGETAPLTVSWRAPDEAGDPDDARIYLGPAQLQVR